MNTATKMAVGLAGLFAAISMGTSAEAQTVVNMGGSSAATPFASLVPLTMCDSGTAVQHINGDIASPVLTSGKLITWSCLRAGNPIVMRYSASGSSDGIKKLQQAETNALSFMPFLDESSVTGCTGPAAQTRVIGGVTYNWNLFVGCTGLLNPGGSPAGAPVQVGWSDVGGSSFHQTGPITTVVKPLDDSALLVNKTATVPFSFVLGNGVQRLNAAGTQVAGPVNSLSQDQIVAILSRQATDWRQLGLGTAPVNADGSPAAVGTAVDVPSAITLCIRTAGSGTKAALQVTVLTSGAGEATSGSTTLTDPTEGNVYFGGSTQDVRDCIGGNTGNARPAHRHAFGYMEADQAASMSAPGGALVAQAYQVKLDGYLPNDPTLSDPQANLKCGKFKYWSIERFNTRNPSSADPNVVTLISDLLVSVNTPANVNQVNPFWVSPADMQVTKNADGGPIAFGAAPAKLACDTIN
jgi:ABC-type phosphate transport system substrate-binding protein